MAAITEHTQNKQKATNKAINKVRTDGLFGGFAFIPDLSLLPLAHQRIRQDPEQQ